jgi:orotate phosphoribosyltransferase
MHLIPTEEEVVALVRRTGALRNGHFAYANGLHSNQHLEAALALRYHRLAKTLTVGLSRLLRANPDIRQIIPQLSVVAATVAGLPVAYGLCEALHARQVYWAEKDRPGDIRFAQYLEQALGERVLLVDDILRSGKLLGEAQALLESKGCRVVGIAVLFHQPTPRTLGFGSLPLFSLAKLETVHYADASDCELCRRGIPLERVEADQKAEEAHELVLCAGSSGS